MRERLPNRYAIGQGEIINSENHTSGQLDIVIYDPHRCPVLIVSNDHSVFPVESVYGAISMKSNLDSNELKDAYKNIASFKKIVPRHGFDHSPGPGFYATLSYPFPVTGIISYSTNRSLDAIANQIIELDRELGDYSLRPDFVAIIGIGIISSPFPIRKYFNDYAFPEKISDLTYIRRSSKHTLFRLYLYILRELNSLILRPLEMNDYDDMPRLVGSYRVRYHNIYVRYRDGKTDNATYKLSKNCIDLIVNSANPVSKLDYYKHSIGLLPEGVSPEDPLLNDIIFEFNPLHRPPLSNSDTYIADDGKLHSKIPWFQGSELEIDGRLYMIDITALSEADFEIDPDGTIDEIFSR